MGLNNFTSDGSNDDKNTGGTPPMPPSMTGGGQTTANSTDDAVLELLVDYNEKFKNADPTQFRDTLIEQVLSVVISKTKPNPLLVGSAGVGKTRIVEDIARRIATQDSLIPDQLKNYTIYELPVTNII
ncbi:MAG: ATP-dependent Clp protease ATP-binding subunit, partial [Gordonia sp. (in: high G+C Gram-positive bacteria)]